MIEKKDAPSPPSSVPTPSDLASTTTRAHSNDTSKSIIDDDLQIVIIGQIKLFILNSLISENRNITTIKLTDYIYMSTCQVCVN